MDDFADLASAARDVIRAGECENMPYRIESTTPVPADDIGAEDEFPQYGYFVDVMAVNGDGAELGPRWLECPADLARQLDELGVGVGDHFQVTTAEKDDTEAWTFTVQAWELA